MTLTKDKNGLLHIKTILYQAKSGAVVMVCGNNTLVIPKAIADNIIYEITDFDMKDYTNYYNDFPKIEVK